MNLNLDAKIHFFPDIPKVLPVLKPNQPHLKQEPKLYLNCLKIYHAINECLFYFKKEPLQYRNRI